MPSHFIQDPWQALVDPPDERFVLNAEDLPLLQRHLEAKLRSLESASEVAKRRINQQLEDIASTTEQLKARGANDAER